MVSPDERLRPNLCGSHLSDLPYAKPAAQGFKSWCEAGWSERRRAGRRVRLAGEVGLARPVGLTRRQRLARPQRRDGSTGDFRATASRRTNRPQASSRLARKDGSACSRLSDAARIAFTRSKVRRKPAIFGSEAESSAPCARADSRATAESGQSGSVTVPRRIFPASKRQSRGVCVNSSRNSSRFIGRQISNDRRRSVLPAAPCRRPAADSVSPPPSSAPDADSGDRAPSPFRSQARRSRSPRGSADRALVDHGSSSLSQAADRGVPTGVGQVCTGRTRCCTDRTDSGNLLWELDL